MSGGSDDDGARGRGLPIAGFTTGQMMLDWPGKLTVTVFLEGCDMDCPFCHSWQLVHPPAERPRRTEGEVLALLAEHGDFYDAVCITGGEPTLHDLAPFIRKVHAAGKLAKVDTNGTRPEALERLVRERLVDYVAMDYKAPLRRMLEVCGGSFDPEAVSRSKALLMSGAVPHEFRTTLVPAIHSEADVEEMAGELAGAEAWFLQRFRGAEAGGETLVGPGAEWTLHPDRYDEATVARMLAAARRRVPAARLRGF